MGKKKKEEKEKDRHSKKSHKKEHKKRKHKSRRHSDTSDSSRSSSRSSSSSRSRSAAKSQSSKPTETLDDLFKKSQASDLSWHLAQKSEQLLFEQTKEHDEKQSETFIWRKKIKKLA